MRVHSNHPDVPYAEQLIATAGDNIPIYPSKIARHINVGGAFPFPNYPAVGTLMRSCNSAMGEKKGSFQ